MRGRDLLVIGQARGVAIVRAGHAQRMRLARHHLGEGALVAADRLGDGDGDVVGRTGDDRLDRVLDRDCRSRAQAELGGRLGGGVLGDRQLDLQRQRAFLELLEQEIERHHLGQRSGMAQFVLVDAVEHAAAVGVDDDGGESRIGRRGLPARGVTGVGSRGQRGLGVRGAANDGRPPAPSRPQYRQRR